MQRTKPRRLLAGVPTLLSFFDTMYALLRIAFLVVAMLFGVLCIVDWMVRTRRVNPMGTMGRFARRNIDPLLAPIEKRVVKAGALPHNAPIYALVTVVLAGIIVLSLLGFLRGQIYAVAASASLGPRGIVILLIRWTVGVLQIALIVRVISSLVRISPYSRWIRWAFVLTEWMLVPLRRFIPPLGMFDITPLVAFIAVQLIGVALVRLV